MIKYWPEHATNDLQAAARRENFTLRNRIDAVMAFIRPPQPMSFAQARIELAEVGAPRPVIARLLDGLVEYRT